jgi:hypothetical protein
MCPPRIFDVVWTGHVVDPIVLGARYRAEVDLHRGMVGSHSRDHHTGLCARGGHQVTGHQKQHTQSGQPEWNQRFLELFSQCGCHLWLSGLLAGAYDGRQSACALFSPREADAQNRSHPPVRPVARLLSSVTCLQLADWKNGSSARRQPTVQLPCPLGAHVN